MVARVATQQAGRSRTAGAVMSGVRATARSFGLAAHQLWLEVTGTVFLTMALFGVAGNFFLNGLSFLAVLWSLVHIRYPKQQPARRESMWASLRGGFRYLYGERQMRVLLGLGADSREPGYSWNPSGQRR